MEESGGDAVQDSLSSGMELRECGVHPCLHMLQRCVCGTGAGVWGLHSILAVKPEARVLNIYALNE